MHKFIFGKHFLSALGFLACALLTTFVRAHAHSLERTLSATDEPYTREPLAVSIVFFQLSARVEMDAIWNIAEYGSYYSYTERLIFFLAVSSEGALFLGVARTATPPLLGAGGASCPVYAGTSARRRRFSFCRSPGYRIEQGSSITFGRGPK